MDVGKAKLRGALVDELQERINKLKRKGIQVPAEWTEKLSELAETSDPAAVTAAQEWMRATLPPKEYETDLVTWDTFKDFADELIKKTAEAATIYSIINGKKNATAPELIKDIITLRAEKATPELALTELGKIRARVLAEFPALIAGE